jgi:sialidase-1
MCIRIPVILETPKGLVAMAEARGLHSQNYNCCVSPVQDFPWCADKDIVMKVSTDNGNEWSPLLVVFQTDAQYFYSNPTPTYFNNYLFMVYTRCAVANLYSNCEVFFASSTFSGQWTIIQTVPAPAYAPLGGPGVGLVIDSEQTMLFPLATSAGNYAIYTSTSGMPSLKAGSVVAGGAAGESQIAMLPNSTLVIEIRSSPHHYFAYSYDNGATWTTGAPQTQLPDSNCEASLFYSSTLDALLYSAPAANVDENRSNVTIYASTDSGINFDLYTLVYDGPSAYSCLFQSLNGSVGILFERGVQTPYEAISLSFIN